MFNQIYGFTTENLFYLSHIHTHLKSMKGKSVLTIGGAFDQAIVCASLGASNIKNIDINPSSGYYSELKYWALRYLTYAQFMNFFMRGENALNYNVYLSLSHLLSKDTKQFWDNVYQNHNSDIFENMGHSLRDSSLFNIAYDKPEEKIRLSYYLQSETYYLQAQQKIQNISFDWQSTSITEYIKFNATEKFDIVLLSNLADYSHKMFDSFHIKKFKEMITMPLFNSLNNDGIIMYAYVFDAYNILSSDKRNEFNLATMRHKYYPNSKEFYVTSAIENAEFDAICTMRKYNE